MSTYDTIIVLGSKPNTTTWEFPSHVPASLDQAANLWHEGAAPYIIVSGKWALSFDQHGITQPYRECDKMAEYLAQLHVPSEAILREGESKDTVSNLLYTKRQILAPQHMHDVLLITADFRLERLKYLTAKILGPDYNVSFTTVPCQPGEAYPQEPDTLARTRRFLGSMADGDDSYLDDKLFGASYYNNPWYSSPRTI